MKQRQPENLTSGGDPFTYNIYSPDDIPEERKREIIEKIAEEIVSRGMTAPAIFFLELIKPLSFIGSQGLIMLNPMIQVIFGSKTYWEFAVLMEERKNVEFLIQEIERRNDEAKRGNK